ncbi:hypothetical protein B0T11DRAFT_352171 [Plectosphaerella cucumerina]|uniref:Protein-S-isoprenylcysteine O-methyltransferase n=1 Tax=Plectosphaerella cucumerina TaxID=40658 RepID=A0A8K0X3L4_9PEZI|nr:hypothetical protein B0T11DRAFT_352171 [Plectosphaerella cucumerina]
MALAWLSQTSLAATIIASGFGIFLAVTPPNPNTETTAPRTGDTIRRLMITTPYFTRVVSAPVGILCLHKAALAYTYPNIPDSLLGYGRDNGLDMALATWSISTAVPLALIFSGVYLRLVAYATLDKNFTFSLAKPSVLTTTGIYRHVQHPSYTALVLLAAGLIGLLARRDSVVGCWTPPAVFRLLHAWRAVLVPFACALGLTGIWTRVREEERMLKAAFGPKWESWHARTARFVPWVF